MDDLVMLRRRSQPGEPNCSFNLAVSSKFIDGVKNDNHCKQRTIHLIQPMHLHGKAATEVQPISTAEASDEIRLI